MAALESAVNSFGQLVELTTNPSATHHPATAPESGELSIRLGDAMAENAEQQCRVNQALIAKIQMLEKALNETNAVVRRLCQERQSRG
jgi:hypothetical protein